MNLTPLEPWIDHQIDQADLQTYQLHRLNETLRLVKNNSRFYRHNPIDLSCDLGHLSELTHWPFTTAADLRADPFAFVCVSQDEIQRVVTLDDANFPLTTLTTSGTTGQPKRLYFTRDDQALTIDFFHIGMSTFTAPGDRVLILLPGETPGSVGDLLASGLQRLGAVPIKHGPVREAAATLEVIRREKVDVLVGVPTHVLALARSANTLKTRLKAVLLSTDHVSNAIKRAIETAFNCEVYNHYGMTEMGLGGGVDCAARRGYHLREADLLFEIIDPVSGERLPDGEYGEVVFTTLTRRGMPLIRYRTGDVSRFLTEPCPCGTRLKTLERITQRLAGRVRIGEQTLTMADLDEAVFALDGVLNFTATLTRENGHDGLHLEVKIADGHKVLSVVQAVSKAVAALHDVDVRVSSVKDIPPSMAKRTILDRRFSA
ncbi:MAG: phenylacetate--CoA ligase family protein [Thermoflexales bacterium]|nr:phenylacetate--CoA ligase family protein [Thermoflexales bacterium]